MEYFNQICESEFNDKIVKRLVCFQWVANEVIADALCESYDGRKVSSRPEGQQKMKECQVARSFVGSKE